MTSRTGTGGKRGGLPMPSSHACGSRSMTPMVKKVITKRYRGSCWLPTFAARSLAKIAAPRPTPRTRSDREGHEVAEDELREAQPDLADPGRSPSRTSMRVVPDPGRMKAQMR